MKISGGIFPEIPLFFIFDNSNWINDSRFPKEEGILPTKLFQPTRKNSRFRQLPISLGRVPLISFLLTSRNRILGTKPNVLGKLPVSWSMELSVMVMALFNRSRVRSMKDNPSPMPRSRDTLIMTR